MRIQNDYKVDDLKDELMDMAKPALPHCIQLEDLVKCGVGDTIIKMLIDCKGFYDYDQRETGGISEDEFEDLDIGGYHNFPCPPPKASPRKLTPEEQKKADEEQAIKEAAGQIQMSPSDGAKPKRVARDAESVG